MTRLTLVRHGETTGQSSIRYYGVTDVPLSFLGRAQMQRAAEALSEEQFDVVFSSTLSRSREGAERIAGDRARIRPVKAFDEVDFGRWEGLTREEIAKRDPQAYRAWRGSDDFFAYPGGESRRALQERVREALAGILSKYRNRHILMVLHRGVIAVILSELLGLSTQERLALRIDLGSIHVLTRENESWRIVYANRVDHLAGL